MVNFSSDQSGSRSSQHSFYRDIIPKLTDKALQQASKLGGPLSITGMEEGFASVSLMPQSETSGATSSTADDVCHIERPLAQQETDADDVSTWHNLMSSVPRALHCG